MTKSYPLRGCPAELGLAGGVVLQFFKSQVAGGIVFHVQLDLKVRAEGLCKCGSGSLEPLAQKDGYQRLQTIAGKNSFPQTSGMQIVMPLRQG